MKKKRERKGKDGGPNPIIERTDGEFFALPYKFRPCVGVRHPEFYGKIHPEFFGNGGS